MSSILFRGAFIRYADIRFSDNNQPYTRVYFSCDWSDTVRAAMEWDEIPDCTRGTVKLTGDLSGTNFILTPSDSKLKDRQIDIAVSDVGSFELVTKKDDEGESSERHLNFVVKTAISEDSVQWISSYMHRIGQDRGRLKIVYAKQEDLPFDQNSEYDASGGEDENEELVGEAKEEWSKAGKAKAAKK